jgi:glycogen debranching enzyme
LIKTTFFYFYYYFIQIMKLSPFLKSILTICFFIVSLNVLQAQPIRIAIVKDHCALAELSVMTQMLGKNKQFSIQQVSLSDLQKSSALHHFNQVWYHRTDTADLTVFEKALGASIKAFVKGGGNVFLSMEAVPLLNDWGIEPNAFQLQRDTVIDEGFGRPLGFHSFKSHPIFDGLLGGVYTSKQKKDHIVRKHGFFGNSIPAKADVIGIQWTYITFTESSKLLLEYNLGKGKIIAAGSYLYYAADNYNRQHLQKFTDNVFLYAAGKLKKSKSYVWDFKETNISPFAFTATPVKSIQPKKWNLPKPTIAQHQDSASKDFYDLVGRKILWMGKMNSGVDEIWMHPFMALRDFSVGVRLKGTDSITWVKDLPVSATIAPEYLIRNYKIRNSILKEIYTVSFKDPAGVAHFEVGGDDIEELVINYASNLRFMWPYAHTATGSIRFGFNKASNSHIVTGQNGELSTVVMYSQPPLSEAATANIEKNQVNIQNRFSVKDNGVLNVYIAGSTNSYQEALSLLSVKQAQMSRLFEKTNGYYRSLLNEHLGFETPDSQFNIGYKWALARTDQFWQTTPGIGTALMAGFGTTARGWNGRHAISGRPGYAWYFGRDGEWSSMAIDAYGDYKSVKGMLETLIRYQDINGKIYHELTSSGVAHYDASDATPLFVILAAHYLRYSGDIDFISRNWAAIKKAIDFCYSTDTDGDRLIENTNVGHGWIEGGSLFGTHTEFYLAGCWAAALDAANYMASHLKINKLAKQYSIDAEKVKLIIDKDFWNQNQQFYNNGKMIDGSFMPDATVLATVPIYLNSVIDSSKARKVNDRLAGNHFSTDWGIRMIEDSSSKYRSGSYHAGMVWPLYGGWAALSEFKTGNNKAGFQHIMNNLLVYRNWGLGSVEETLNGDQYKPNGVCSQQCWSETMVLQPAIEGMLGLYPDAMTNTISLSPYFPWDWKFATVRNIKMGNRVLDIHLQRALNNTSYTLSSNGPLNLNFNPKLPLGTKIKKVLVNGKATNYTIVNNAEGITLQFKTSIWKGKTVISIDHEAGIGALPIVVLPQPGDISHGARILSEVLEGNQYKAIIEARPGTMHTFNMLAYTPPGKVEGAVLKAGKENVYTFQVDFPSSGEKYISKEIRITFIK